MAGFLSFPFIHSFIHFISYPAVNLPTIAIYEAAVTAAHDMSCRAVIGRSRPDGAVT